MGPWLIVALFAIAPGASAATFSSASGHYSFAYPDGWAEQGVGGVDTRIDGPLADGFAANMVAQHWDENGTQDTAAWLLSYTRSAFDQVKAQLNVTELQAARVFITNAGRRAADYVYDWTPSNQTLRQRQVIYVSPHHGFVYALTLTSLASDWSNRSGDWSTAVDSFAVSGETGQPAPTPPADPLLVPLLFVGGSAGVVLLAAIVVTARKKAAEREAAAAAMRAARAQSVRPGPSTPAALSRAPPGGYAPAPPPKAPPVPPRPAAPPKPARPAAPAAVAPPPAREEPRPIEPKASTLSPEPPPPITGALIRCPKCKSQFAGPANRPAPIECPKCGTRGMIR